MSQFQTQRTASFNSQQVARFSQRIRDKESNGDLITYDNLLEIFQKYDKKKLQVENFFKEIEENEENGEHAEYIEYDDDDYDGNSLDYIGAFCFKYLTNIGIEELLGILSRVTSFFEKNRPRPHLHPSNYDAIMTDYFSCIDSICNFITKNINQGSNKFDFYADFFLVSLKLIWIYLKPYKQKDLECVESQYNTTSVINSILTAISSLIEKNLTNLTDAKNEISLLRMGNVFLYLIDYFKDNSKSVIQLWKAIRKGIILNSLLTSTRLCEKRIGFFFKNIFPLLCNRIYEQLEMLKICFANLATQQTATQQQIMPDTNKTMLLGNFLFKIFKNLLETYLKQLQFDYNKQFFKLTINLCSLINSLILSENVTAVDVFLGDSSSQTQTQIKTQTQVKKFSNSSQYQDAKMKFLKEFTALYEDLLKFLENATGKNEFFHYFKNNPIELDSLDENSEKMLLFYCVLINRSKFPFIETTFLNDMLNLLEGNTMSLHFPSYVLRHDEFLTNFNFEVLSKLNYAKRQNYQLEFYDFVHYCLSKFLLSLKKNALVYIEHIYFLANNILECKSEYKYRSKISYDLLLSIGNLDKSFEYLIFLCQIYELDSSTNHYFKLLLLDLFESYNNSTFLKSLEKHLIQNQQYRSYSLLCKYVDIETESNKAYRLNVLDKNLNLFTSLIELIKNLSKMNTSEQIWIKKVVAFIQTNNVRNEILTMQANILNESNLDEDSIYESLQEKLIQFVQLTELDNLLKYFEAARTTEKEEGTFSTQTRQRLGLTLENLKIIYSFISNAIELCKLLLVRKRSQESLIESKLISQVQPLLKFLSKHCSIDLSDDLDINKSLNLVLTNIKCQTVHLMRVILTDTEVKDQHLQRIFSDLFFRLLNDSNMSVKFFTLECLTEVPTNSQIGIKLMKDFAQSEYDSKEFFLCFYSKTPFNSSLSDYVILSNRSNDYLKTLQNHYKKSDVSILMSQFNTQYENLDDTMNALMTTMHSIDEEKIDNEDKFESEKFKNDAQLSLCKLEENLEKLLGLYNNTNADHLKNWLKQNVNSIKEKFSFII